MPSVRLVYLGAPHRDGDPYCGLTVYWGERWGSTIGAYRTQVWERLGRREKPGRSFDAHEVGRRAGGGATRYCLSIPVITTAGLGKYFCRSKLVGGKVRNPAEVVPRLFELVGESQIV